MHVNLFIDGKQVESRHRFEVINPSTEELFGTVDTGTKEHVDAAISAAHKALPAWKRLGVTRRAEILHKAVESLRVEYGSEGKVTPLKDLISSEMGKRPPEADVEVIETSDMLEFFVERAPILFEQRRIELDTNLWATKQSYVTFEPVGVIGVIKPWNYPLEIPSWALGPALVAGNTVVFKPSEHSSFVGAELVRILHESGLPNGVINLVTGGEETGKALVQADGLAMVSFTGSVEVGRYIAEECAKRHRRCSLELGGNDPAIVLPDADKELSSSGLVWGCFANSGQVCVRPKRIFVHTDIAVDLVELLVEKAAALRADVDFGPLISGAQLEQVDEQVTRTVQQGAKVLLGAERIGERRGFYYKPTILNEVPIDSEIMQNECFGPVMPIVVVHSAEEAVSLANQSRYGLGASIWTSNLEVGQAIANNLEAGMVWINDVNVAFPQAPWGGVKQSGPGIDLGDRGLQEYVVTKHINVETDTSSTGRVWWFPYS